LIRKYRKGTMREIMERRFRYKKRKWVKKIVKGEGDVEKEKGGEKQR